jgi:hypothetical protein
MQFHLFTKYQNSVIFKINDFTESKSRPQFLVLQLLKKLHHFKYYCVLITAVGFLLRFDSKAKQT